MALLTAPRRRHLDQSSCSAGCGRKLPSAPLCRSLQVERLLSAGAGRYSPAITSAAKHAEPSEVVVARCRDWVVKLASVSGSKYQAASVPASHPIKGQTAETLLDAYLK